MKKNKKRDLKNNTGLRVGDKVLKIKPRSGGNSQKELRSAKKGNDKAKGRSRLATFLTRMLAFFIAFGFLVGVGGFTLLATWMAETPDVDLDRFTFIDATTIYDINDDFYQQLETSEKREAVTIDEVPELIQMAFVSIEDQRFYSHLGIDIRGTLKAVIQVLLTRSTSGSGGSTITQQLIKQTHLTSETTIRRKVMEWKLAYQLEKVLNKRQILGAYLNKINLSYAWGIESACRTYFGLHSDEIDLAQACVLAAIMKAPTAYSPYVYETDPDGNTYLARTVDASGNNVIKLGDANRERAKLVCAKMLELGHISRGEYEIALAEISGNMVGLTAPQHNADYTYFTDAVYAQVINDLMVEYNYTRADATELVTNGGLKIYATVDPDIQTALDHVAADDSNFYPQNSAAKAASQALSESTGDEINYIPQLGGAVIQNKTGYVVGIIGGREKSGNLTMNRGLQKFQVGSSTKPLTVYASGIDSGSITLADVFADAKIRWGAWKPANAGGGSTNGPMTIREALTRSINMVAIQAEKCQGDNISAAYALKFGLELTPADYNSASLALGGYTYGQTPLAMADAYTTFPNGGYRITPSFYRYVTDSRGIVILTPNQEKVQVISEQTAWLVTSVLKNVVRGGTTWISLSGQEVAGKTGTTDNNVCAWFCGYTAEYSGAFWIGYDVQRVSVEGHTYVIRYGSVGGNTSYGPAGLWKDTFTEFYSTKNLPSANLPERPEGLVYDREKGDWLIEGTEAVDHLKDAKYTITVCGVTGLLPNGNCPEVTKTIFDWSKVDLFGGEYIGGSKGGAPTDVCTECVPGEDPLDTPEGSGQ